MDLVSVVTPLFNSQDFVRQAIMSVKSQTYTNWEMLIVDDCSTDQSNEVVKNLINGDPRIRILSLRRHSGPAVARNYAISCSHGRYIAFLDSDDLWEKEKLEQQIAFMKERKCVFSFTSYKVIDQNGAYLRSVSSENKVDYRMMLKKNYIGNSTVMLDAGALGKVFSPLIEKRNDYALWLRVLKKTEFALGISEELARYRIRPNSVSGKKLRLLHYHYRLFREVEGFSVLTSVLFVIRNVFYKLMAGTEK